MTCSTVTAPSADLSVTKTDGVTTVVAGDGEVFPQRDGHVAADVNLLVAEMRAQLAAGRRIAAVEVGAGIVAGVGLLWLTVRALK